MSEEEDREAILRRREAFVANSLEGLGGEPEPEDRPRREEPDREPPRPCLKVAPPPEPLVPEPELPRPCLNIAPPPPPPEPPEPPRPQPCLSVPPPRKPESSKSKRRWLGL